MLSSGIYVPLITPLDHKFQICESSVAALISLSRDIVAGYVPCLSSGEGWLLSDKLWHSMLSATRREAPEHLVIAGIVRPSTAEVVRLAQAAESLGANGTIFTSPTGESISQDEIYQHYKSVHDATSINLYIYNETEISRNIIEEETLIEISLLPRVVGIKESTGSVISASIATTLKDNGLAILQGQDSLLFKDRLADGNLCSLSNLYPELCLLSHNGYSSDVDNRIAVLCEKHKIFKTDWYRHIKRSLHDQGVISTSLSITDQQ